MSSPSMGSGVEWRQSGDMPGPRFGHSTTLLSPNTVVLFGGAVGDTGNYQITNECYCLVDKVWKKIEAENAPRARAAHGAARVDWMQMVVYGGATGGGTLSSEELYLMDCRKYPQKVIWMTVPISGPTPGRRYGHTMNFYKPNLIVFGGNNGQSSLNDIWYMDVVQSPFLWSCVQIPPGDKKPPERVYHSAEICRDGPANGMLVIFGGRTNESESMKDIWGLRQHRDGTWDWVIAPVKKGILPESRFQHSSVFIGTKMFIIGGREHDVNKVLSSAMYDTETCEWKQLPSVERFRHSCWSAGTLVFTFGGFDHSTQTHPTNDLQIMDILNYLDDAGKAKLLALMDPRKKSELSGGVELARKMRNVTSPPGRGGAARPLSTPPSTIGNSLQLGNSTISASTGVKLASHVITQIDDRADFSSVVRKVSIDRLNEESKKIRGHQTPLHPSHAMGHAEAPDELTELFIRKLLQPNISQEMVEARFSSMAAFPIPREHVLKLILKATELIKREPMVLHLRAPIKTFGDIHGQYYDMMRLFGSYRCPVDESWFGEGGAGIGAGGEKIQGDIDSTDYLFLGDFVDRGCNSLEVMCLLLALKCRHPRQIHLIRGNHEDAAINGTYGFKDECRRRLGEDTDSSTSCWKMFNSLFEYLPLGAVIEDRIFCIHGGIGGSITSVDDVSQLQRPLKVSQLPQTLDEQKVTDLLWSDPTENDSQCGIIPNDVRDPDATGHIVRYGPDRVVQFLEDNQLDLIIRAHECVMDGFERFAAGRLITLFSATDYCNTHKNAGALLYVRKDLTVVPKIIYPASRQNDAQLFRSTWLNLNDMRPPTPPRSTRRQRHQQHDEDDWQY